MHRSNDFKFILPAMGALAVLLLAGCSPDSPTWLNPASPNAAKATDLFNLIFLISVATFVLVEGLLLYSVIRFRRKSTDEMPTQIHGNTRLEIAWTVAPALVLLVVFGFTWQTLNELETMPTGGVKVKVVGSQWWWHVEYPDLGVVTANEIHVPVNQPVTFSLEGKDVIHSFWVPELGGKRDLVPGKVNTTWFRPTKIGTFRGACAEFCGSAHANMRFTVVVQSQDDFNKWVAAQKQDAAAPVSDLAKQGEQEFVKGVCVACHTIGGTAAKGTVGPNLTHFAARKTFGGGIIENNTENLKAWLKNPQALKPGNIMVIPKLTDTQVNALVEYLNGLK